ncbi:peptidoglycan-associated lipoprotein Pal [Rhodospirillum rubrum]|uniref:Peptidoglycan-associated lipoprotein n=1 Tax=Rhodospirillum rubrum (strain ATCC 11170 / ATH 1.1.1 / DSM 467 / LMG 4362 / NCIMB 8255 / S1) TaxID=269796 RepID=Q2RVE9_RHORT|nr:peptidoglycan-associated lipoprotein Pal [Rhodospirillum rubrum]ABC21896.1 OmpA/MotB [Rhodospirillum rubrum ATCC 11170]AEO47598.1 OmpA/MotB [Rhodospirillum rubrum F11]MBK1664855.1 peptidoglycan-associated lipoprotein [Rhodospirillum rubrum]MBK1676288.1 peptidoglycan-associated lipoprotein [Rhodospirillum rubrum]MBK5953459.1 peptidoglycan-associated lipoprotein [Rhodospirillum rubrum]
MMKFGFLGAVAATMLLAACSSTPDTGAGGAGAGGASSSTSGPTAGSVAEFQQVVGDRVFFGYDQYNLAPDARATLQRQAQWLNQYGNFSLTVEGHADERGTREYNLALGERRANSVREFLISQGVSANRLRVVSYGKERPVCTETAESCYARNRRGVSVPQ